MTPPAAWALRTNGSDVVTEATIRHSESGATLVEFSVVGSLFFFLILLGAELLRLSYTTLVVQYVSADILRETVIGPSSNNSLEYDHAQAMKTQFIARAYGMGVAISPEAVRFCVEPEFDCQTDTTGNGGEMLVLRVQHRTQLLFWGEHIVKTFVLGRNEVF